MSDHMISKYKDILNALDEMQQSPAYAARKHTLFYAEQAIFSLEQKLLLSEKYKAQRDELLVALRPFSRLLKEHHAGLSDGHPIFGISDSLIDAGDLRRAVKAVLEAEQLQIVADAIEKARAA